MARLILNRDGVDLVTHELVRDIVMIGRAQLNHIVIDHPTVSAQHVLLLRVGDSYCLKDSNSTNGTQINGVLVTDAELKDGDKIRFGSVVPFLQEVAANGGQTAGLENSGRVFRSNPRCEPSPVGAHNSLWLLTSGSRAGRAPTTSSQHVYEIRPRKDHRGVNLISPLPFGRLWYGGPTQTLMQ